MKRRKEEKTMFPIKIYIWLDDERTPNWAKIPDWQGLVVCKNYESAVAAIQKVCNKFIDLTIDLDHDLGEEKTGYDFCKWLVENGYKGKFHCHTMNPVGRQNMRQLLLHYGWEEI